VIKEKTRQEIFIEKGMSDRQRIVLAGAGDQKVGRMFRTSKFLVNWNLQPGIAPGDVIFVLNANPHESFERNGSDLLTHVTITLSEALLGFSRIILTHLDGRGIKFSSPPGKIIKPDDAIVLRGEGMPVHKQPDEKGNLYVIFEIEMPTVNWLMTVDTKVRTHYLCSTMEAG
jgi:DnaJ family protein A protein 2